MELVQTDDCFVCGGNNHMGLRASFQSHSELLCSFARVPLGLHFQGWEAIVHGGILAALLDEACIYAALGLNRRAVTAELQVRYHKPVPCGCEAVLFGEVAGYRRTVANARSRLVVAGEVCATAEARLFLDKSSMK